MVLKYYTEMSDFPNFQLKLQKLLFFGYWILFGNNLVWGLSRGYAVNYGPY